MSGIATSNEGGDNGVVLQTTDSTNNGAFNGLDYLMAASEINTNSGGGCFINAPTIIHGPTIIQHHQPSHIPQSFVFNKMMDQPIVDATTISQTVTGARKYHINTTCSSGGGRVTITTPMIQSGGCVIQTSDTEVIVQASPRIDLRPQLSGGGYCVQKRLCLDMSESDPIFRGRIKIDDEFLDYSKLFGQSSGSSRISIEIPPSGCQELPGTRRDATPTKTEEQQINRSSSMDTDINSTQTNVSETETEDRECCRRKVRDRKQDKSDKESFSDSLMNSAIKKSSSPCCCTATTKDEDTRVKKTKVTVNTSNPNGISVQLSPNINNCTLNIITGKYDSFDEENYERRRARYNCRPIHSDGTPIFEDSAARNNLQRTPQSWLANSPWVFDDYLREDEVSRLEEVKQRLRVTGWYHEGLTSQECETLLQDKPIGTWLLRDSSDINYIFCISAQTDRGPTSIRVRSDRLGRFGLDADSKHARATPLFSCPIRMLEFYVMYSKIPEADKDEVWINCNGKIIQIFLSKPLLKEVRPLVHLARLVCNRLECYKKPPPSDNDSPPKDPIPCLLRKILSEYPYHL